MYTLNQLTIIGFTGNDAEAHYTPNGTLVVTLSVATKESWKDADGLAEPYGMASCCHLQQIGRVHTNINEGFLRDGAGTGAHP